MLLPRQGEVAGTCQSEGEESDNPRSVSSPSVTFGATSPGGGGSGSQNGLTITSTTISVTASAGTSFSIRNCFPASVGFPAASFFA